MSRLKQDLSCLKEQNATTFETTQRTETKFMDYIAPILAKVTFTSEEKIDLRREALGQVLELGQQQKLGSPNWITTYIKPGSGTSTGVSLFLEAEEHKSHRDQRLLTEFYSLSG